MQLKDYQTKKNDLLIFKSCAVFTDYISKINNTHSDNDKCIDVVMSIYNLIEYSDVLQKHQEDFDNITKLIQTIT